MSQETLTFPPSSAALLTPYLPPPSPPTPNNNNPNTPTRPFLTLTYAHSLDASLSLAPGIRTTLSGPQSKAMTHYLRTQHDTILIGVGTAVADDPALNSRIEGAGLERQPRPVVLDPKGRWDVGEGSKVVKVAREGRGLGPWVLVSQEGMGEVDEGRRGVVEGCGGRYITVGVDGEGRFGWGEVLRVLGEEGVRSVMVEGGGEVINSLLGGEGKEFVDSVIVTIAPTWLGQGGVVVSPPRAGEEAVPVRLKDVKWCPLGEDVVLCGRIAR